LFPDEPESYELEGKILMRMKRWKEAITSYLRARQLVSSSELLGLLASCH
jgi:Flp pilus assembly protein TadD